MPAARVDSLQAGWDCGATLSCACLSGRVDRAARGGGCEGLMLRAVMQQVQYVIGQDLYHTGWCATLHHAVHRKARRAVRQDKEYLARQDKCLST
jgi:hypothetical protein